MTFDDYWDHLVAKTPQLREGSMRMDMTVKAFRDMMMRSFREGAKSNPKSTKSAAEDFESVGKPPNPSNPFDGIFGDLFGTK